MKHKYITDTGYAYWVRFYQGAAALHKTKRKCLNRSFNFNSHNGKHAALKAALEWRDEMQKKHGITSSKTRFKTVTRGESHVVGVCHLDYIRTYPNGVERRVLGYSASWVEYDDEGNRFQKSQCYRYNPDDDISKRNAWRLACRMRKRMVAKHYARVKTFKVGRVKRRG